MRTTWLLIVLLGCTRDVEETDAPDTDVADTDVPAQVVRIETSVGAFSITLDDQAAPATVANFLTYVDDGFYDGDDGLGPTIFHRVIDGFVVQGGGVTASGDLKATHDPIENESGRSNLRGTVAMARTSEPDSATSQFYVNLVDNTFLDEDGSAPPGYAVFGEVTSGMDVIDASGAVATDVSDRPNDDVVLLDVERE